MRFEGHSHAVTACAHALDGSCVLSASGDQTLREWDRATGQELRRFEGHTRPVNACTYAPGGLYILSASDDQTLRLWCRSTGQCVDTLYGTARFNCLAVASGGIVAGDAFGNLWILACDWF